MPLPSVTKLDPEVEGEGGIDPLCLAAAVADRLAEDIVPGVTSRMSRPRLLTLLTLGSAITDGLPERGKDGPPDLPGFFGPVSPGRSEGLSRDASPPGPP
jgi:hypothetical protein